MLTSCPPNPLGLGRVVRDASNRVLAVVEERDCTSEQRKINEVNTSVYFAKKEFLLKALSSLRTENAQKEYYLTDIISYGVSNGYKVEAVKLSDYRVVLGVNSRLELSRLEKVRREEIVKKFMDNGVTFEDPQVVYIDENVKIGQDCFIGAGTRLKGNTDIAENVIIEGNAVIVDSKISSGSVIKYFSVIEEAEVGRESIVGPFARLRPQAKLERKVHVGNFVEIKKSTLETGVKANHLTYIGDAEVGENTNIGAGTITCNYDGVNKHKTKIGKSAFVGSNTAFVAPVSVGDGALIGAGSVITRDVPADALGLERSELKIVEGWAKKKREELQAKKR